MGMDELKLKNIVTRGLETLFLYLKRTELINLFIIVNKNKRPLTLACSILFLSYLFSFNLIYIYIYKPC